MIKGGKLLCFRKQH